MLERIKPRYTITKRLASGVTAFYFNIPTKYRQVGCDIPNEPLGTSYDVACGVDGTGGRAAALNGAFDEWDMARRGETPPAGMLFRFGTIDWLFREYKSSKAYLEKVSERSRPGYERTMLMVTDLTTKAGAKIGSRMVTSVTPRAADKLYDQIIGGKKCERLRQGEKAVGLCRKAWRVVRRLYPDQFPEDVPNPWEGVTLKSRVKGKKKAVTRDQVYEFAWGCIERGRPEPAAAAVICFEFLQRPENVLAGLLRWPDYRSEQWPNAIRIEHHKTKVLVWHPLEENIDGATIKFYADAEEVISKLPRRGTPMILRSVSHNGDDCGIYKPYSYSGFEKIIQKMRKAIGLPDYFTLDACRHGGMTELEEAELTDGQGRALSGHKTKQAYAGYSKETYDRALAATRRRHAHLLANEARTNVQNEAAESVQNAAVDAGENIAAKGAKSEG